MIGVLDKGYVRYIRHMGDDLGLVNDLRTSFVKESKRFGAADEKLIRFCFRRRELSAWRHHALTVEVKAPLMVARQLYKYSVGSCQRENQFGWNESSRRYVTMEPEFYVPVAENWRGAPENRKQGSSGVVPQEIGEKYTGRLEHYASLGTYYYEDAMTDGICAEQARGFLPAYFLYIVWRWTMSLNAWVLIMCERLPHDAQEETREYAGCLREIARPLWPVTVDALDVSLASR